MWRWITITGGILLLINQGAVINSQEFITKFRNTNTRIIVKQGDIIDIAKVESINAIVNPTNFSLDSNTEVAKALQKVDPKWYSKTQERLSYYKSIEFCEEGEVRSVVTKTFSLKEQGVPYIINTVGPKGGHSKWKEDLRQAYLDSLIIAEQNFLKSIIFPPISTGTHSLNASQKVTITPGRAAKIALCAVKTYIRCAENTSIEKIFFISKIEDGPVHFLFYKKLLAKKDVFTNDEKKKLLKSKYEHKLKLEKLTRFKEYIKYKLMNFIKQRRAILSVGAIATLASLYLLKKYRYLQ